MVKVAEDSNPVRIVIINLLRVNAACQTSLETRSSKGQDLQEVKLFLKERGDDH